VKRLHDLRVVLGLSSEAEQKLAALLELIANDPSAPTSIKAPSEAVDGHVADSLSALPVLADLDASGRIIDIGSGAGFPGLPLAIAFDPVQVDLLESITRKCRFISRVVERLDQSNVRVVCARAEDWARDEGAGLYVLGVARAVASLATLVEYASPLLVRGGHLVAWKGARDFGEESQGAAAAAVLGMTAREVHSVCPFPGARHRHLHVFQKTGPTPDGIPRRAGMARRRPFGHESSEPNY